MVEKLLVVDDEPTATGFLRNLLEPHGYEVIEARNGRERFRMFFEHHPQLALIDLRLPGMDSLGLAQRIREVSYIPIIVLSALGQEFNRVKALDAGADDYITKPIDNGELVARVRAALRRATMPTIDDSPSLYQDSKVTVDFSRYETFVRGKSVSLTPIEFRLLSVLVKNVGRVLTQQQLLDHVWGVYYDSLDAVRWHIGRLRKKLGDDLHDQKLIITIRGVGYRYDRPSG